MPCLSGRFDPAVGVLLQVSVAQGGALERARQSGGQQDITGAFAPGLVDTGASKTCISPALAQHLGLAPHGQASVQTATRAEVVNTYLVDLALQMGNQLLFLENLEVLDFSPGSSTYQLLIGMDIVCKGVLIIEFSGHFSFSI